MQHMKKKNPPKIVCLCGSVRFLDKFLEVESELTFQGHIVLSLNTSKRDIDRIKALKGEELEQWIIDLDWLHKRKIDLADEVFVINVDGHIGKSTSSEVEYAKTHNKPITYLVQLE